MLFKALLSRRKITVGRMGFWVTPFDIDINMHMNNASYLKFMALGRWDLILRMGVFRPLFKERLQPAVVHIDISFKKALWPGTYFNLITEIGGLSERSFIIKQKFMVGDKEVAQATVKAVFVQHGRAMSTEKFRSLLSPEVISRFEHLKN